MTVITTTKNGRMPRKTLSNQLDRLDDILDGLAEALNQSVAMAVKEAVGLAAREAVSAAVQEVVANADLLRAAAAQHIPSEPEPQESQPKPPTPQQTVWGRLGNGVAWVWQKANEKARQVGSYLSMAGQWCLAKLGQGCRRMADIGLQVKNRVVHASLAVGNVVSALWQFRRSFGMAVGVGLLAAVSSYLTGPMTAAVMFGLAGVGLTLAGLVLVPLAQLLLTSSAL